VCQLYPVFLSDILSDVTGVTSIVQSVLYPTAKAILSILTTCIFSKAEHWDVFYEPPGIIPTETLFVSKIYFFCA